MYRSAKASEKYSVLTPFNVVQKILGPYMFSPTSRDTLNDKIELYFHDYSFVPLFIQVGRTMLRHTVYLFVPQENYLKTNPSRVRDLEGPRQTLKQLKLMEKASESISDGDLIDSLIHGYIRPVSRFPHSYAVGQPRTTLDIDANSCGSFDREAVVIPLWARKWLRRPECYDVPTVRSRRCRQ
jgi:replication factor C subunit 1